LGKYFEQSAEADMFKLLKKERTPAGLPTRHLEDLSRQQQQVLQAVLGPLPQIILQTALLHGGGDAAVVSKAALAAARLLSIWLLPGLQPAVVSEYSGGSSSSSPRGGPMETAAGVAAAAQRLLDCWLLLMQQQLLQADGMLLVAARAQQLPQGSDIQEPLLNLKSCSCSSSSSSNSFTSSLAGTAGRTLADAMTPGSAIQMAGLSVFPCLKTRRYSCAIISCKTADAVGCLLAVLHQLGRNGAVGEKPAAVAGNSGSEAASSWGSRAAAVMVVLETIGRQIVPHIMVCGYTGLAAMSNRAAAGDTVAAQQLRSSSTATTLRARFAECFVTGIPSEPAGLRLLLCNAALLDVQLQPVLCAFLATAFKLNRTQPGSAISTGFMGACGQAVQYMLGKLGVPAAVAAAAAAEVKAGPAAAAAAAAEGKATGPPAPAVAAAEGQASGQAAAAAAEGQATGTAAAAAPAISQVQLMPWLSLLGLFLCEAAALLNLLVACRNQGPAWPQIMLSAQGVQQLLWSVASATRQLRAADRACAAVAGTSSGLGSSSSDGGSGSNGGGSSSSSSSSGGSSSMPSTLLEGELAGMCSRADAYAADAGRLYQLAMVSMLLQFAQQQQNMPPAAKYQTALGQPAGEQIAAATANNSGLTVFLESGVLQQLAQQLQGLGSGLCAALPVSWCCDHPDCTNMGGFSELQLVGGKGSVCGGCKVAR
jgi:hypothetical protein